MGAHERGDAADRLAVTLSDAVEEALVHWHLGATTWVSKPGLGAQDLVSAQ